MTDDNLEQPPAGKIVESRTVYAVSEAYRTERRHVCGLSGYNPLIDPPCEGCIDRMKPNERP